MATELPHEPNDVQLLHEYLGKRLNNGGAEATLDETLADFREYKRQLSELKSKLSEAEQDVAAGRTSPVDAASTKAAVRERLAQDGITD